MGLIFTTPPNSSAGRAWTQLQGSQGSCLSFSLLCRVAKTFLILPVTVLAFTSHHHTSPLPSLSYPCLPPPSLSGLCLPGFVSGHLCPGWLAGCPFISFCLSKCRSLDPPSHSCSLGPFSLSFLSSFPFPYFLCCSLSPSLSSSLSVFVLPSHGCFISLCLCISPSVPPLFLPLSLFLCVSGFCSDGPSASLYFYPSDTPPVSTSLSVCLSPSRFSSGPSSWSQLVGGRQGSGWPPIPGSSLPLAAPNEPGVGVTRCPRPPGLRHWPLRGLLRRYKGAASLAAGSPLRGRAPCKWASGVGGWMMGSGFWAQTRASLSSFLSLHR